MFRARGQFVVARSSLSADCAVGAGVASVVVLREGLWYDSRLVAASAPVLRTGLSLYAVLEGCIEWADSERFEAPVAFALPPDELECRGKGAIHYRVVGERVRMVEHWLDGHAPVKRSPTTLKGPALAAAEALYSLCSPGIEARIDSDRRAAASNALLDAFADEGWCERRRLSPSNAPEWERLSAALGVLDLQRSLKLLADIATVSERQFYRDFGFIDLRDTGFREALRRWRLRLGVLLLSAPEANVAEVARAIGYSRAEAMSAMFKSAGLPSPSELRASIAAARTA